MQSINFDQAAKRTPGEPKLRQFFDLIAKPSLVDSLDKDRPAIHEQPFLSPLAWAYYSAYQAIVMSAYATARVLAEGLEWIDSNDPSAYDYLLDEIKDLLLLELRKTLEGREADREAVEQAKRIAEQLRKMEKYQAEEIAAVAKVKAERT